MDVKIAWATLKERTVRRMAESHTAGSTLAEALWVCEMATSRGWLTTLCPWSDLSDHSELMFFKYYQAIQGIVLRSLHSQLSLKLPDLAFNFDLTQRLVDYAHEGNILIQLDSLDIGSASKTMSILGRLLEKHPQVGVTIPARWRRSFKDAEQIVQFKIPVRIVKGQWPDSSSSGGDVRERFLELVDVFAGHSPKVTVATHDNALAQAALHRLVQTETPCELEQLVGLPLTARRIAEVFGVPYRLYVPYGGPHLPYNLKDVWSRPRILSWAVRDLLVTRQYKLAKLNGHRKN